MDAGHADRRRPAARHPGGPQSGAPHLPPRGCALAAHAAVGDEQRSRLRPQSPKRARIVALSTPPPEGATVLCVDELGPVTPRNFPPAPGWSADGHRIKVPLDYERGPEKVWVYGALAVRDGQVLKRDRPRTQHRGLSGAAARRRRNLSARRSLPDRRQFGQPPEWTDPGVARGPPPDPARPPSPPRRPA